MYYFWVTVTSDLVFRIIVSGAYFLYSLGKNPKEVLAIRRIFSLVDMITNTNFSNWPNVFKIGVVQQ